MEAEVCVASSKLELSYGQITEPRFSKYSRSARKKWTILNSIYDLFRNPTPLLTSTVHVFQAEAFLVTDGNRKWMF